MEEVLGWEKGWREGRKEEGTPLIFTWIDATTITDNVSGTLEIV